MTLHPPRYRRELLGRDPLLGRVRDLLGPGRIVTLAGTGGIGKTRLAAEVARRWSDGAARFVAIGSVRHPGDVARAVADALGLAGVRRAEEAVPEALHGGLVVLDELEHVLGAAPLLARWIETTPDVCWLATSRHALGVASEVVVEVPPLPIAVGSDLALAPSARLFLAAAGLEQGDLPSAALAAVLHQTGGLPLALELAAGRLVVLPFDALMRRLEIAYLATLRDPVVPQRALATVLEDTCAELPQDALAALGEGAVFAGTFSLEAAEAVSSLGERTLDALHALVRWHLVSVEEGRMWLLEPIRRFALERGDASAVQAARERHAAFVTRAAAPLCTAHRRDPTVLGDLQALAVELRAVLDRAAAGTVSPIHGLVAGQALCLLYDVRGPGDSLLAVAVQALDLDPGADPAGARAWCDVGVRWARFLAAEDDPQAAAAALRVFETADRLGVVAGRVRGRIALGTTHHRRGDLEGAEAAYREALAVADRPALRAAARTELALLVHDRHAYDEAWSMLQEALAEARSAADDFVEARALELAATMTLERARFEEAERWNRLAVAAWERIGDARHLALADLRGARITEGFGDLDTARGRYVAAEEALARIQARQLVAWAQGARGRIALVRGDLDEAEALLGRWANLGALTSSRYHIMAAFLAAWRGDVASAEAHVEQTCTDRWCEVLRDVAIAVAAGFAAQPGSAEAAEAAHRAEEHFARHEGSPMIAEVAAAAVDALHHHARSWVVALDGTWFRSPGSPPTDLSHRQSLARVLATLAVGRRDGRPPLDVDALFEAGWPGQRVVRRAAANRVYVALSTLRKAGLDPVITRAEEGGWHLDPNIPVVLRPPEVALR